MGGNALKKVITTRKNKEEYYKIKEKVSSALTNYGISHDFIPEISDKESFGDLDVLYSNQNIIMRDIIIELFSPKEMVSNDDVISFDYDNFQIDFIKCKHIEFSKFYFSYGDFGCLMGKILKKYNLTFGHNGLFLKTENNSMLMTTDVEHFCKFISIDFEKWKEIKTKFDLFELVISSKFYKREFFISGNHEHRRRIKNRPIYNDFLKYIGIDEQSELDDKKEERESVFTEVLDFFNKREDLDTIQKAIERNKIIHTKFNGGMLKDMGYTGAQIGKIIKTFKSTHVDFDEWVYSSSIKEIEDELNKIILEQ